MKGKVFLIINMVMCALLLFNYGCGRKANNETVLVRINNYNLTVDDFNSELAHSLYAEDKDLDKESFLDFLIGKQLLIEEAQRQGIDKSEAFMKTIERYWKQTLIKELLGAETARIEA